jgi:tetratricopeptide (TPR) repeat protein
MNTTEISPESLIEVVDQAEAFEKSGKVDDAINAYQRWLRANQSATAFAAHFNLAVLLFKTGLVGLAQEALRATLRVNPNFEQARALCVEPTLDERRAMCARLNYGHKQLKFAWLGHGSAFQHAGVRDVISHLSAGAAEHLVIAWGQDIPTGAIDVSDTSDEALACKLRTLEVDVLVDMMAWNANCRPGIVAYHPASLVVSWTPNPTPSGLQAVDAVLASSETLMPSKASYFKEKILSLEIQSPHLTLDGARRLRHVEAMLGHEIHQLPMRLPSPKPHLEELAHLTPPQARGRRYVIVAPPFHHASAGIRVLYELQKWLVLAGYDALVCTWFSGYPIESFADDIVIYPEVAPGNLLQAKRVVRYILNTPGKLGSGEKTYGKDELLVAYNSEMAPYADGLVLQVPATESFFYTHGEPRDKNAFYVGKGQDLHLHPTGCVQITKSFPPNRKQVANFLRTVSTLYTYDDFTILIHEAKLCGCTVILINSMGELKELQDSVFPSMEVFRQQLDYFINITQGM